MNLKIFINGKRYPLGKRYFLVIGNDKTKPKYLLAMKLTLFFLLSFSSLISAKAIAQISITVNGAPLEQVLKEIRKQSGYGFIFNSRDLKDAKAVTVNFKNASLEIALKEVFKNQPFSYEIGDKSIILRLKQSGSVDSSNERNASIERQDVVKGVVKDSLGNPLSNVTVRIKGTSRAVITSQDGSYVISGVPNEGILQFSMLGYKSYETGATGNVANVILVETLGDLAAAEVTVNTGYQSIPKERATGSFAFIDSSIINRAVSTNLLERLNGMASGLLYTDISSLSISNQNPLSRPVGIQIRGLNSLSPFVSNSPLIVVDNFPFEGDLQSLNPNDIESITLLKDAAAASIWGARSGNGVIVVNTKRGKFREDITVDFSANTTIQSKPNLEYDRNFLPSSEYIDAEVALFNSGYFDSYLSDNITYQPVSPVVELLAKIKNAETKEQLPKLHADLASLRQFDVRKDYEQYFYQKAVKQQYSIGFRGGTNKMNYSFFGGYDRNIDNAKNNGFSRITINTQNTYRPTKNLEISTAILYSNSKTEMGNMLLYGFGVNVGGPYAGLYPYAKLADEEGRALPIVKDFRTGYIEQSSAIGLMDWNYRPLDEISLNQKSTNLSNLILRGNAEYKIKSYLKAQLYYQNERQKISNSWLQGLGNYYTRNLINRFTIINEDETLVYQVPRSGGILDKGEYDWNTNNGRLQLSFDKTITSKHNISSIVGIEVRELSIVGMERRSYGYDERFGSSSGNLDYSEALPVNPAGTDRIPVPDGSVSGTVNRYFSQYLNASYAFANLYTLTVSGRRDGTNLFGVKTNDKITPLWSVGAGWQMSNEEFFKSTIINYLKFRATLGYNGNVYHGSAYVTGFYFNSNLTGLPTIIGLTPPNPELSWERIRNINGGVDYSLFNGRLNGSLEYYNKVGKGLVQSIEMAPSGGFTTYFGNAAVTSTQGLDFSITSANLTNKLHWNTTLYLSLLNDKLKKYDVPLSSSSIMSAITGIEGKPIQSIFSYKWGGLDGENGDPQGYLNGSLSKDYVGIINNYDPDSLVYNGSSVPTIFGSVRNDFSLGGFSISLTIGYKLGYFMRRPSTALTYSEIIQDRGNRDYLLRWQKPGDESRSNVPSVTLDQSNARTTFYQYSEILVDKADHIRLQDIRFGYDLKRSMNRLPFRSFQIFSYLTNLGIIWRANKHGIDPDVISFAGSHYLPNPFSISFGIKCTL